MALSAWVAETLLFALLIRPPPPPRTVEPAKGARVGGSIYGAVLGQASLELTVYPAWSRVERWSSCLSLPSATLGLAFQQSCPCLSSHEAARWAQRVDKSKLAMVWFQIFLSVPSKVPGLSVSTM